MIEEHLQRDLDVPVPRGDEPVQHAVGREPPVAQDVRVRLLQTGEPLSEIGDLLGRRLLVRLSSRHVGNIILTELLSAAINININMNTAAVVAAPPVCQVSCARRGLSCSVC